MPFHWYISMWVVFSLLLKIKPWLWVGVMTVITLNSMHFLLFRSNKCRCSCLGRTEITLKTGTSCCEKEDCTLKFSLMPFFFFIHNNFVMNKEKVSAQPRISITVFSRLTNGIIVCGLTMYFWPILIQELLVYLDFNWLQWEP